MRKPETKSWGVALRCLSQPVNPLDLGASRLTKEVREQLSSRVAMYYPLPEHTLPEAKAIIERGLGADATDEVVAQTMTVTGGIHRSVDMILPSIFELKSRQRKKLESDEVRMKQIITVAGTRVMAGVGRVQ